MTAPSPARRGKVDLDATRERLVRLGLVHAADHGGTRPHRFLDGLLEAELQVGSDDLQPVSDVEAAPEPSHPAGLTPSAADVVKGQKPVWVPPVALKVSLHAVKAVVGVDHDQVDVAQRLPPPLELLGVGLAPEHLFFDAFEFAHEGGEG